jgi:hypothetical protein
MKNEANGPSFHVSEFISRDLILLGPTGRLRLAKQTNVGRQGKSVAGEVLVNFILTPPSGKEPRRD